MEMPFFSIIVVSLNAEKFIDMTIKSILCQKYRDFEVIIKDGLSTDATLKLIPDDPRIHVFSEADNSIYEAMNQAIQYASGRVLYFLNCGDVLYSDDVLEKIVSIINCDNETEIFYGNYVGKETFNKLPSKLSPFFWYRKTICHQAAFYSKNIFKKIGYFNQELKICADYEHFVQCYFNNIDFVKAEITVCRYLGDGVSQSKHGIIQGNIERKKVIKENFGLFRRAWYSFLMFWTFRPLRIWLAGNRSPRFLSKIYHRIVNGITR